MSGVCYAFQRGECERGSSCRYSHDLSGGGSDTRGGNRPMNNPQVCFNFQRGHCDRGESCRFSHSTEYADGGVSNDAFANFGSNRGGRNYGGSGNPGMCHAFQRGECNRGDSCRYSHDTGAGSYGGGFRNNRPSSGICYAFQRGECDRGDACRFSHDTGSADPYNSYQPRYNKPSGSGICYAFQRGECQRGDTCRYSHDYGDGSAPAYGGANVGGGSRGICFNFQRGHCDRGDSCRFIHETAANDAGYPAAY